MGETFAIQTPDEGLEFRIYKELFATQYWNGNAVFFKKWARDLNLQRR